MQKSLLCLILFIISSGVFAQSQEHRCDCDDFSTPSTLSNTENVNDLQAVADHVLGPTNLPPFKLDGKEDDAVFIDIKNSTYNLEVTDEPKRVEVTAIVEFETLEAGLPLIDLPPDVTDVTIDDEKSSLIETKLPCGASSMKYINKSLPAGKHRLVVHYILKFPIIGPNGKPIDDKTTDDDIYFKLSDLNDRGYLERYLPTNLTSDQYPFEVNVKFHQVAGRGEIIVMSNGEVNDENPDAIKIKFPETSNASSMMLHFAHKDDFIVEKANYYSKQKNGEVKTIPLTIYMSKKDLAAELKDPKHPEKSTPDVFVANTIKGMHKAESLFGPVNGDKFIVKAKPAQTGGMEYAMAVESGAEAIDHEILHSYFGRGIQSKDGNSQWLDEGVAVWLEEYIKGERNISGNDKNEALTKVGAPFLISANLGARSAYHRNSERNAYRYGANFMSYLDWKIKHTDPEKGLKDVLVRLVQERTDKTWDNNIFLKAVKDETGIDVQDEFDFFVKGRNIDQLKDKQALIENVRTFENDYPHKKAPKVPGGETSLIHLAASGNSVATFNALYNEAPGDLTKVDTYGRNVLSYAMAGKNTDIVKRIVELGYPVNPEETKKFVNKFPQWEDEIKEKMCGALKYQWVEKTCK